jgi:hypothetical protein
LSTPSATFSATAASSSAGDAVTRLFAWGRRAAAFAALGGVAAMLVYPGGTYLEHSGSGGGYRFFHNFFSDLGATVAFNGQPNRIGALLFVVSLVVLVIGMGGILVGLGKVYSRSPSAVPFVWLATLVGVFVCASFIGVAVTPENHVRSVHVLFTKLAFRAFPGVPLFLALAARRSARRPQVMVAWVTMLVLLIAYVAVLDFGPRASTPNGLVVQVTAQKIVAVGAVLLLVYQSFQAEKIGTSEAP